MDAAVKATWTYLRRVLESSPAPALHPSSNHITDGRQFSDEYTEAPLEVALLAPTLSVKAIEYPPPTAPWYSQKFGESTHENRQADQQVADRPRGRTIHRGRKRSQLH